MSNVPSPHMSDMVTPNLGPHIKAITGIIAPSMLVVRKSTIFEVVSFKTKMQRMQK